MLPPTSSDLVLAFVRPFKAENKVMRLFNARRSSWLGHAMEPVLNYGLRAFPINRAEAACDSMSTDTHRHQQLRRTTYLALNREPPTWRFSKSGAPRRRRLDRPPTVSLSSTGGGVERQINRCRRPVLRTSFSALTFGTTQPPPAKAGGLGFRTESPDTRRLNDASYSGSILKSSFGLASKWCSKYCLIISSVI